MAVSLNSDELWQRYVASKATGSEEEKAFRIYVSALSRNATRLLRDPVTSKEDDTSNQLLPSISIAFADLSYESLDKDVVTALEDHCRLLVQQLSSLLAGTEPGEDTLMYAEHISQVLLLYGLWKDSRLLPSTLTLCVTCHKLLHVVTSEVALRHLLIAMSHLLGFMHHVLDPDSRWKRLFIVDDIKDSPARISQEHIQEVPPELSHLFIEVFKEPSGPSLCPKEFSCMQLEMLHVIGAAATGLLHFAEALVTPEVINQLLVLLHPSRNSGCGPVQALALKVFIKVLHVLHCFMPKEEQVEVDTGVTLSKLLNILPIWLNEEHKLSFPTFFISLLNSISLLMNAPKDSDQLKELFAEVGCFEKLVEALKQFGRVATEDLGSQLVCSLLRAFTAIMKDSRKAKDCFRQHLSYRVLKELSTTLLANPTRDILQTLLNMALEVTDGTGGAPPLVCNADALGLCLEWLLDLPHTLQQWLSNRVLDLCSSSVYNKQQCCGARLTSTAVQVLVRSQEAGGFSEEIEDNLLRLIEGLGTHSIVGTELKDILVSLRPLKSGENIELPTYYFKLQYVLRTLANRENGIQSLYYFELRQPKSGITISGLHHWPNTNAFSFHCWVSLDRSCADMDQSNKRRMLYSFYAGSTGFEAFFTKDLVLVVAVHSRKRGFKTISATEALTPQEWHSVCITHSAPRKPWGGKNETFVYIDQDQKAFSTELKAPDLSADYKHCNIGFCQHEADVLASPEVMVEGPGSFGPAISLFGRISSVYIFSEVLQPQAVQLLHNNGPNDLSLFQPKYSDTEALIGKLVLFYHPKACKDNVCVDLSPSHTVHGAMDGALVGEVYVTRDVKLVLSSLGGVEVFFPILEQAGLPLKQKEICSITDVPRPKLTPEPWNDEHEAVTSFFSLLSSMLATPTNEQVFFVVKGPATIGALLQKVSPSLLTVAAHSAIESLVKHLTLGPDQPDQQTDIYSSLLFNYRIWSRAEYSVQLSHSNYLSTIVSGKLDDCRRDFGVQFVLDVIREYYNPSSATNPKLSVEEKYHIRESLMSIINLYITDSISSEELDAILGFLCAVNDESLLDEMLKFILGLLTTPTHQDSLSAALWEKGVVFLVRIQAQDLNVRLTTIKVLTLLNRRQGHNSAGLLYRLMHSRALSAALHLMHQQQLSSSVVLALLDLCIVKNDVDCTDYISNYVAYTSTLQLLRHAPLFVRHTSCLELQSLMDTNSNHARELSQTRGWERILLRLLTPSQPDTRWQSSSSHRPHPDHRPTFSSNMQGEGPSPPTAEQPSTSPIMGSPWPNHGTGPSSSPGAIPGTGSGASLNANPIASVGLGAIPNGEEDTDKEIIPKIFRVVMETIEFILWNSTDPMEANGNLRRAWSQFFSTLDLFAMEHRLIVPAHMIKERLLTLLMGDVRKHCSSCEGDVLPSVILQMSQLLEAFIIASNPSFDVEEDFEVALLAFSHNPTFELNREHCSLQLLELYSYTLKASCVLDRHAEMPEELEIARSYLRILMACTNSSEVQYNKLCLNILQLGWLPVEDVRFVFLSLTKELGEGLKKGQTEKIDYITKAMRCLFTIYVEPLEVLTLLPNQPCTASPTFSSDLVEYSKTKEWQTWLDELRVKQMPYFEVLQRWLRDLSVHARQCRQTCSEVEEERREEVVRDLESYEKDVLQVYNTLRDSEITRHRTLDVQHKNELSAALQRWSGTRRFLTGECGAWKSRDADLSLWKMDRTENFSRIRLKLARNYNYNKHSDASQQSSGATPSVSIADTSLLAMATAAKSSTEEEEHLFDQIQKLAQRDEPSVALEKGKKEKLMRTETCQLVTVVDVISGTLDITNKCIYFVSDPQDKDFIPWYPIDFKVQLSQLREVHMRRYNASHTALEMFLVDRTNYFLNFPSNKILRSVCSCVLSLYAPNLIKGSTTQKPAKLVQSLGLTQKWVKREITNFDYIMQLNTISGRTYNDLNQYPVFPWILKDYTSDTLDLNNPEVFRDLSKPMGIQNPDLVERIRAKYEDCDDEVMGRFHYGTHYSNASSVIHYMVRLEPFTSLQIKLQSGKFDWSDRQFFSIPNTWRNTFFGSDVKELIPEFFYLPDFLRNINGYDFGVTQDKIVVGDVILPRWASSPEDFIRQHRDALESEYVSAHLNEWIDLVFGCKQSGPEAERAMNVFNRYSYQENVDLDNIEDEKIRRKLACMINNFGQTPTRLFNEKHPTRIDLFTPRTRAVGGKSQVIRQITNWKAEDLCTAYVEVGTAPVVFLGTPSHQTKTIITNNETLVTVTDLGAVSVHGWLPYSNGKLLRPFVLQPDLNTSKCPCLGGPFDKDLNISSHLFALSSNNKLLLTAGHWDNSFRTYSLEKNKMVARTTHHTAVVTCLAVDRLGTEDLLITGSKDTTCVIWKFSKHDPPSRPQQTLYGHDAAVLCVDICSELDIAISGAKNGTCLVHTIRSGQLVHKLTPRRSCEIRHVAVSPTGTILVYSVGSRSTGVASTEGWLHLYSINGRLLEEKKLSHPLTTIVVEGRWVITGNEKGVLAFRDLFSFKLRHALSLSTPIDSISAVLDHQTKLCTHLLVGLREGKLIIVSPKDALAT